MNKPNKQKNKHIDADNRMVVTRGEGSWGSAKRAKEVKYMVTDIIW